MIASSLYILQERIMFFPTELPKDYTYSFRHDFEELFLKPEEGVTLNAIQFKVEDPKGVILYFHGNAGDLSRWGVITEYFVEKDYDVLVMDYRTYGKSVGKLSESALYKDAQFCYDYLMQHYSEKDIVLYGRSLGTGIAAYLAATNTPKSLILETPYFSIEDVAKHRFPFFPVSKLLHYKLPTYQFLSKSNCDVLIIHGTADKIVPYSSGRKLYDLGRDHLNFVSISGGGHNDLVEFNQYHDAIEAWLKN